MKLTKREYIHSLEHDLHVLSLMYVKDQIRGMTKELEKIKTDKTYKPWKE